MPPFSHGGVDRRRTWRSVGCSGVEPHPEMCFGLECWYGDAFVGRV
jgi:hypothetical protein